MHDSGGPAGRAVVCVAADGPRSQVTHALVGCGFEVVGEVDRGLEVLPTVAQFAADVIVLDIALVGTLGLRLIGLIKSLRPGAAVVALVPLPMFHDAAVSAGADAAVAIDDLRRLRGVLEGLAGSPTG